MSVRKNIFNTLTDASLFLHHHHHTIITHLARVIVMRLRLYGRINLKRQNYNTLNTNQVYLSVIRWPELQKMNNITTYLCVAICVLIWASLLLSSFIRNGNIWRFRGSNRLLVTYSHINFHIYIHSA